jgi:hypothetical protein
VAIPVCETEPPILVAGDTWSWCKTLPDYRPSHGWELHYALRHHLHPAPIDLIAKSESEAFRIDVSAKTTATFKPGDWSWQSFVVNGDERHTIQTGTLTLKPAFTLEPGAFDGRSENRRLLDAVRELLSGRTLSNAQSYQIQGRAVTHLSPAELHDWERILKLRVDREEGKSPIRHFGVTFGIV